MTSFSDFADAMAVPQQASVSSPRRFQRVAVLGGGPDARMLAAIALSEGCEVGLFSAYGAELEAMTSGIALRGSGPVGSYQVNADNAPSVQASAELDGVVRGADLIFLTGPVHKQRTYAMVLADHLSDGQVLAVAPGRTFAALETRWLLGIGGCAADITIAETPLPFWIAASGSTLNLSNTSGVCALLPGNQPDLCEGLAPHLPGIHGVLDTLRSSFSDGSGLIEVPALLMGGTACEAGGPTIPMGGTPLAKNQTFRNLIGPQHHTVIADLAGERHETARKFGVRDLPDVDMWLDTHAGAPSGTAACPVPDVDQSRALLRDAVIGSLVPLTSAARLAGVETPATDAMIALASSVLKADLATAGRKLPAMGIDGADIDTARRALERAVA